MAEDGWLVSTGDARERSLGGYVSTGTERKRIIKAYVATSDGNRELFFDAVRTKTFTDTLSASDATTREDIQQFTASGTASLTTKEFVLADTREHPPAEPTNVSASTVDHDSITVSWDDVTNEDNYRVQRKNIDTGSSYTTVATPSANSTSYTDNGLSAETTYQYRVRAENTGGNSNYVESNQATTDQAPPSAPSSVSASLNTCPYTVDVSWGSVTDADDYDVQRRNDPSGSFGPWGTIATGVTSTSYTDTNPAADGTNEYRVRACNTSGCSSYSTDTGSVTTPGTPTKPGSFSVTYVEDSQLLACYNQLTWNDSSDECSYDIYRDSSKIDSVSAGTTQYNDSSISDSTSYTYHVEAINDFGGTDSDSDSVTTGDCPFGPQ
jgi:fibronectin type 3 domain-containing protein